MKRALVLLAAAMLLFINPLLAQDTDPPQLHGATLLPPVVNMGDTLFVTLDLSDNISGVDPNQVSVQLLARTTSGHTAIFPLHNMQPTTGNFYRGYYIPTVNDQFDSIFFQLVSARDHALNHLQIDRYDMVEFLQYPYLSVGVDINTPPLPPGTDTVGPVIDTIWIVNDTVYAYDTLFIKVVGHDNGGGQAIFNAITFKNKYGQEDYPHRYTSIPAPRNGDTITIKVVIAKYGDNGNWTISKLRVRDSQSNMTEIDTLSIPFYVIRQEDNERPVITDIQYVPDVVHRGDSVRMYLTVRDTISGIFHFPNGTAMIRVYIKNAYGQQLIDLDSAQMVVRDSLYYFDFRVSEFAADSIWKINFLAATDSAGNNVLHNTYYNYLKASRFFYVVPDSFVYIRGNVRTSTGAPLQNSRVYTVKFTPSDSTLISNRATYTDSTGNYFFVSEQRDSLLFIKAIPNDTLYAGEIPTYLDTSWLVSAARQLTINSTTVVNVDTFATLTGVNTGGHGFVTGLIVEGAGKRGNGDPIEGLFLILTDLLNRPIAFATTDANGIFEFSNVPNGTYQIYADWIAINNALAPTISLYNNGDTISGLAYKAENNRLIPLTVGIEQIDNGSFALYPNPNSGSFSVRVPEEFESAATVLNVYNTQGRLVYSQPAGADAAVQVDLAHQSPGLYVISISDGKRYASVKFRVE